MKCKCLFSDLCVVSGGFMIFLGLSQTSYFVANVLIVGYSYAVLVDGI